MGSTIGKHACRVLPCLRPLAWALSHFSFWSAVMQISFDLAPGFRSRRVCRPARRRAAAARWHRADSVRELRVPGGLRDQRQRVRQQVLRRLSRAPLLRRPAIHRPHRNARGRARQGAVPRRARQRAAAERLADESGRVHGVPRARRHGARDGSLARRSPDARRAGVVHGQDLQLRALQHAAAARRHRLRRRARDGEASETEDRAVRTLVLSARVRLRALPLDRRRRRRA